MEGAGTAEHGRVVRGGERAITGGMPLWVIVLLYEERDEGLDL